MEPLLEVVIGGMYSGKSTELVRRLKRLEIGGSDVALFKPRVDNRYSEDAVVTHTGLKHPAIVVDSAIGISDYLDARQGSYPNVIGVDEAQFFDPALYDVLASFVKDDHIRVIVAGLDTNFKNEPWPTMVPLVFGSDLLTKLNAVCTDNNCGSTAARTQRIVNGQPVTHGDDVLVGATEAYEARCRHCFQGNL